jgi:hypothetical protein
MVGAVQIRAGENISYLHPSILTGRGTADAGTGVAPAHPMSLAITPLEQSSSLCVSQ